MTDRISCCVPYCKRSHAPREGLDQWICHKHWSSTERFARKVYTHRKWKFERDGDPAYLPKVYAMWEVIKKQAIERAVGI